MSKLNLVSWMKKITSTQGHPGGLTGGHQDGFGLVETLVAIALLGIAITAFVGNLSAGTMAVRVQNENTLAQGLAQTQMEVIKAAAYDYSGSSYKPVTTPEGYTISIATAGPGADSQDDKDHIQQVTVTVKHNGADIVTLEDYKVNR